MLPYVRVTKQLQRTNLEYSRGLYAKTPISTISQKEKKEAKGGACVFGCFPIPCLKLHGEKEPKQDKSGSSTQ